MVLKSIETHLFNLGDIKHATEWPPVPFDDSNYHPCGLAGCFSCQYLQLLRHRNTEVNKIL